MNKFLLFLLFTVSSFSQVNPGLYISAGLNSSNFKTSDLITSGGIGYKGGFVFCVGENENENFQLELFYSNSTFSAKSVDNQTYTDVQDSKFNFASLDFGMYYNYYFFPVNEDQFYIGAQSGLTIGFSSAVEPDTQYQGDRRLLLPHLADVNKAFNDLPAATFSPGVGITGGYNDFRFVLRYNHGLTNILKSTETNSYNENNRYTGPSFKGSLSSLSFTVAYIIL